MTNFERIKAMDMDGLAKLLAGMGTADAAFDCPVCTSRYGGKNRIACEEESCVPFLKAWLGETGGEA